MNRAILRESTEIHRSSSGDGLIGLDDFPFQARAQRPDMSSGGWSSQGLKTDIYHLLMI